jgi:putative oxidoreductase
MKSLKEILTWGDQHHPKSIDFFRIVLGLTLIWKGIAFLLNLDDLDLYLKDTGIADKLGLSISITFLSNLIIILHLIGGVCISLGLRTRLFCVLNLPVLFSAVLFITLRQNIFKPYSDFWLSLLVLSGLVWFLIVGNGKMAVDQADDDIVI